MSDFVIIINYDLFLLIPIEINEFEINVSSIYYDMK